MEAEKHLSQHTSSDKSKPTGEMDRVTVRVRRLDNNPDLPLPTYQSEGSSGLDLRAAVEGEITLQPGEIKLIPTGLSISLPYGYEAQVRPRSGLALQYGLGLVIPRERSIPITAVKSALLLLTGVKDRLS